MNPDVYICFARPDRLVALDIAQALERHGLRCFTDIDQLTPGADWSSGILKAISSSKVFLLVLSNASNQSTYVRREVESAAANGLPIVPVRVEAVRPSPEIEYFISTRNLLDAIDQSSDRRFERLVATVEQLIGSRSGEAPTAASAGAPAPIPPTEHHGILARILRWGGDLNAPSRDAQAASAISQLTTRTLEDLAAIRVSENVRAAMASIQPNLPETFDRVARLAGQASSLQSRERRMSAIEEALAELSLVQSTLPLKSSPVVDAIRSVATGSARILSSARAATEAELDAAREIENPFIFGNPVYAQSGGLFTGRRDIVAEIERNVLRAAQTPTMLLYGQRRMGKTSILNQLPSLLGPHFLPVLVDGQAPAMAEGRPSLLRYLSRCFVGALETRLGSATSPDRLEALPLDGLRGDDSYSVLEDWLDRFEAVVPAQATVLLCIDEFERLQEAVTAGWGARFLDGLRHWMQHRPRFAVMFVGSHTLEQLGPEWTDRFLNARRIKVSFLAEQDVRELLSHPTPTFALRYAPGVLDAFVAVTNGQPFLTQALAFELVQQVNEAHRNEATRADVEAAVGRLFESAAEYFADFWGSRSPAEQALLTSLAAGAEPSMDSPFARGLCDYDVLNEAGDFAVPLVKRWVRATQLMRAGA